MEANRASFELARDKIIFALTGIALVVTVIVAALDPNLVPMIFFGGGGIGGLAALARRRARFLRQT